MTYLDSRSIPKAICTRNFDAPVNNLLSKFLPSSPFSPIITRDFRPPKPDPAGILHIARTWGLVRNSKGEAGIPSDVVAEESREEKSGEDDGLVPTAEGEEVADASALIMVGDSIDDMAAGKRAGATTVLLVNGELCIGFDSFPLAASGVHCPPHPETQSIIPRRLLTPISLQK